MGKRLLSLVLALCVFSLTACGFSQEKRLFEQAYRKLQKTESLYVVKELYFGRDETDLKLLSVCREWRYGDDFFYEYDGDGDRALRVNGKQWRQQKIYTGREDFWRTSDDYDLFPISWWTKNEPNTYLTGEMSSYQEGNDTVLVWYWDHGYQNCTMTRQVSTHSFYLDSDGDIIKYISESIGYNHREIDPNDVNSISRDVYYITFADSTAVQNKIQDAQNIVAESIVLQN